MPLPAPQSCHRKLLSAAHSQGHQGQCGPAICQPARCCPDLFMMQLSRSSCLQWHCYFHSIKLHIGFSLVHRRPFYSQGTENTLPLKSERNSDASTSCVNDRWKQNCANTLEAKSKAESFLSNGHFHGAAPHSRQHAAVWLDSHLRCNLVASDAEDKRIVRGTRNCGRKLVPLTRRTSLRRNSMRGNSPRGMTFRQITTLSAST